MWCHSRWKSTWLKPLSGRKMGLAKSSVYIHIYIYNSSVCSVTHVSPGIFWYLVLLGYQQRWNRKSYKFQRSQLRLILPIRPSDEKCLKRRKRKGAVKAWWCREEGRKLAKTTISLTAAFRPSLWNKNILIELMSTFKKCPLPQNHPLETLCFEPAFSLFIPHW